MIFSQFGKIKKCEVIKDFVTGDSLQYAFIEFETSDACEEAYLKMANVIIDNCRIHVDFSQSVSKLWNKHNKGRTKKREYYADLRKRDNLDDSSGESFDFKRNEKSKKFSVKDKTMEVRQKRRYRDDVSSDEEYVDMAKNVHVHDKNRNNENKEKSYHGKYDVDNQLKVNSNEYQQTKKHDRQIDEIYGERSHEKNDKYQKNYDENKKCGREGDYRNIKGNGFGDHSRVKRHHDESRSKRAH